MPKYLLSPGEGRLLDWPVTKGEIDHAGFEIALTSFLMTLFCACMICMMNNISYGTFTWKYVFIFCFSLLINYSISSTWSFFAGDFQEESFIYPTHSEF